MSSSLDYQSDNTDLRIYDCEIHLKFRLIEENLPRDGDQLLETLLDALSCGTTDECIETILMEVRAKMIPETEADPSMRRQLMRLRNSTVLG